MMEQMTNTQQQKNTALLVATLASFLTPFLGAALNVALPEIGTDLGADAILLNLTATIYLLATAVFLLPFGRLADIVGRKSMTNLSGSVACCSMMRLAEHRCFFL